MACIVTARPGKTRPIQLAAIALALLAGSAHGKPRVPRDTVRIDTGTLKGVAEGKAALGFKGIPFAAPPVGPLRWRDPVAPAAWRGTRAADRFGPSCAQVVRHDPAPGAADFAVPDASSEDCLYLNVWTPVVRTRTRRPVIVWMYGGGFTAGSSSSPAFNGEGLARKGVVVVSFNYRLGIFGFLAHPELDRESPHGVSGNYGLLDAVAALRWVRRNIAAFGGDPANVTFFGQSAGAGAVQFLSISPQARGLFQKAIGDNGIVFHDDPYMQERSPSAYRELKAAESDYGAYLAKAGLTSLVQLRATSARALLELPVPPFPPAYFRPVVDGWLIPRGLAEGYAGGDQSDIPFMAGWTTNLYPRISITADQFRTWSRARYGGAADEFFALYPFGNDQEAQAALLQSSLDSYRTSLSLWAEARRKTAPVYLFTFDHHLPGVARSIPGAYAGGELGRVRQRGVITGVAPGRIDQAALGVICRGVTSSICGVKSAAMPSICM